MNGAVNTVLEKIKSPSLILAWSLYDLANQFFALNVVSLYFVRWITLERGAPEIFYSIAFGISMFLVGISAPILGAISDKLGMRRPFLVSLTLLSIIFTMLLGVPKSIFLGLLFFAIANFGCQGAIVFYNAQMADIAPKDKIGLVSGVGRMFGYSGAILALYLIKPTVLNYGYQATFLPTGILFLLFSLPCMFFIKDKQTKERIYSVRDYNETSERYGVSSGVNLFSFLRGERYLEIFKALRATFSDVRKLPGLADFLKAAFFGLCAVNAVILFMSVYATKVFGFSESQIINLLAFSTLFAIAGSGLLGFLSDFLGHKRCLLATFFLWSICFLIGAFARSTPLYWFTGALAGTALGATWVVSRALITKLVPAQKIGAVFGLFGLVGYISAIIGGMFWGLVVLFLSPLGVWGYRITLFSLIFFMLTGFIFLLRIPPVSAKSSLSH